MGGIERGDIHLWRIALQQPPEVVMGLTRLLSPDEQARMSCYRSEEHRQSYAVARAALRMILGRRYVDVDPRRLAFSYGAHGKPLLADRHRDTVHFNVSHSGGLALCAVSGHCEIGIDLERIRHVPDAERIVTRFFSSREQTLWRASPQRCDAHLFFSLWTRKEALSKARGAGFFETAGDDGESLVLPLVPARSFIGALAVTRVSASDAAALRLCWHRFDPKRETVLAEASTMS